MLTPIYTIFTSKKTKPYKDDADSEGWTPGAMEPTTPCWETIDGVMAALNTRFKNMENGIGRPARFIKNTLKRDEYNPNIVEGAIYYEQNGIEYMQRIAQLILVKKG